MLNNKHADDSNGSKHVKLAKFAAAVDMMRTILHPLKCNEILLFASINGNINIYSFQLTKQTYTLLKTRNSFHDIYNHSQFFKLDSRWKLIEQSKNTLSTKDIKIDRDINNNKSNVNHIRKIHIDTVCNYYNSKTQSHYIIVTGSIQTFVEHELALRGRNPWSRSEIPFCQFFNLNTIKWQEIVTSSTTKTIKKNNNNDDTDYNIDMDKIVQSRNWSNLHSTGHRSLVFNNRYFLLSGGLCLDRYAISVFEICCGNNIDQDGPILTFIHDIRLNDGSFNGGHLYAYVWHGFVLLPQHTMDNLSTDIDGYNSDYDLNSQIAQMYDESVTINVLLFGGWRTVFRYSFCQLKLIICTNYGSQVSATNFYSDTKDVRVVLTDMIDNPYWMKNFGGHIKTTCINRGADEIYRDFRYDIISQRYLIIVGQSNMGPKDGIIFCDTKSKAQEYNINDPVMKLVPPMPKKETYQWDVSQIKMPYDAKIDDYFESCVVTMYDSENNINGLQLCIFNGSETNNGKHQIVFDQNFVVSVGINGLTWQQERIIWIGYFKQSLNDNDNDDGKDESNDKKDECLISYLPKDIVWKILLFLRNIGDEENAFFVAESTSH